MSTSPPTAVSDEPPSTQEPPQISLNELEQLARSPDLIPITGIEFYTGKNTQGKIISTSEQRYSFICHPKGKENRILEIRGISAKGINPYEKIIKEQGMSIIEAEKWALGIFKLHDGTYWLQTENDGYVGQSLHTPEGPSHREKIPNPFNLFNEFLKDDRE